MELAIVIPYYKIDFFKETLQSLAAQTDKRFCVYIGDDASPSDPSVLIRSVADVLEINYTRFENNLGGISLVDQWERCLSLIQKEKWFIILGDDDVLGVNVVEEFYRHLSDIERNQSSIVRYASIEVDELGQPISGLYQHPRLEPPLLSFFRKLLLETRGSLSEHIFRNDLYKIKRFKKYNLAWGSDERGILDIANGQPIFTINESIVYVRISSQSITGKVDKHIEEKTSSYLQLLEDIYVDFSVSLAHEQRQKLITKMEHFLFLKRHISRTEFFVLWSRSIKTRGLTDNVRLGKISLFRIFKGGLLLNRI